MPYGARKLLATLPAGMDSKSMVMAEAEVASAQRMAQAENRTRKYVVFISDPRLEKSDPLRSIVDGRGKDATKNSGKRKITAINDRKWRPAEFQNFK